jgi:hypothetical protein
MKKKKPSNTDETRERKNLHTELRRKRARVVPDTAAAGPRQVLHKKRERF